MQFVQVYPGCYATAVDCTANHSKLHPCRADTETAKHKADMEYSSCKIKHEAHMPLLTMPLPSCHEYL